MMSMCGILTMRLFYLALDSYSVVVVGREKEVPNSVLERGGYCVCVLSRYELTSHLVGTRGMGWA